MLTHDQTQAASVHALLGDLRVSMLAALERLNAGAPVDLSGMDVRFGALCACTLALPPPLARANLPALHDLRAGLDALTEALTRLHQPCPERPPLPRQ